MIIDTHCHYNLSPLTEDWQKHWLNAQEHGVDSSILVGVDFETSEHALEIAQQETNFFAAIGIHPNHWDEEVMAGKSFDVTVEVAKLKPLVSHSKTKAIGETGLDYFHLKRDGKLDEMAKEKIITAQQESFRQHISLAQQAKLSLIIHARDIDQTSPDSTAYWDVLKILRDSNYTETFVLHCASGPLAYIHEALEMGAYIGAAGNITYKNADHIREIARATPKDHLLSETDSPFLPPQNHRGTTCEPWMISETVQFIENELNIPADQLVENARQAFNLV